VEPQIDRVANVYPGQRRAELTRARAGCAPEDLKKTSTFQFDTMSDGSGHYSFDTTGTVNLRGNDAATVFTQDRLTTSSGRS
jgi:hypothetical protein